MASEIPLIRLSLAFVPVVVVLVFMYRWSTGLKQAFFGLLRMVLQLAVVGYVLGYLFHSETSLIVILALCVMLVVASWIAMRSIPKHRNANFLFAVAAIFVGGGFTLAIMTIGVLSLEPWYEPRVMIPLAGMTFSSCMNAVSIGAERYFTEIEHTKTHLAARTTAMKAAFIPITNSLYAVGIVSIPGMMTGQVLAGVSPLIAARYQVMVMCLVFGAAGISVAVFLKLVEHNTTNSITNESSP